MFKKIWDCNPYIVIFISSILLLQLLIANPGYYSHDELQKLDYILSNGFESYMKNYVSIHIGNEFGSPVRPFSFAVQGVYALFMESYPIVVHLLDVLTHMLVALLLYKLIVQFGVNKKIALLSSLIFIFNPNTVIAIGWSAALMDRHYVLFALVALLAADKYIRFDSKYLHLIIVFFSSIIAILSKETAIVTPALLIIVLIVQFKYIKTKKFWTVSILWLIPIVFYLLYRLPALLTSFNSSNVGAYSTSLLNVPENIWIYFAYPFLTNITESISWIFLDMSLIWIAVMLNVFVSLSLGFIYKFKFSIYYLFFYVLFIVPVLLLPSTGGHYLYGSGLVLSTALAAIILTDNKYKIFFRITGILLMFVLITHSYNLQKYVYQRGSCMNKAMITMESAYL